MLLSALHFLTHIGLGWIVAGLGQLSWRDRVLVVLAGTVLDLDGIGILWSAHAYEAVHRAAGHGLPAAVLVVALAMLRAERRWLTAALAAVSFHLHLLLDVVGTGGLPIRYLWPFADWSWTWRDHWVLASWPNAAVTAATALGVVAVECRRRGTLPRPAIG